MKKTNILWIAQTAIFIAILIIFQYLSKPLGQFVTGSLVNLTLITACLTVGLYAGLTVSAVSTPIAFMLGIGPAFPLIIPFVILGNMAIVLAVYFIAGKSLRATGKLPVLKGIAAVIAGAVLKFAVLYFGIVKLALKLIPDIKPPQVTAMTAMFSWPQLVTAAIGATLALALAPALLKALKFNRAAR